MYMCIPTRLVPLGMPLHCIETYTPLGMLFFAKLHTHSEDSLTPIKILTFQLCMLWGAYGTCSWGKLHCTCTWSRSLSA